MVAGQALTAAGGAMTAVGVRKAWNSRKAGGGNLARKLCRRSVPDSVLNDLDDDFMGIPAQQLPSGPLGNLQVDAWGRDLEAAVSGVFSIFLVIKLMTVAHPRSKVYFQEMCDSPQLQLVQVLTK